MYLQGVLVELLARQDEGVIIRCDSIFCRVATGNRCPQDGIRERVVERWHGMVPSVVKPHLGIHTLWLLIISFKGPASIPANIQQNHSLYISFITHSI